MKVSLGSTSKKSQQKTSTVFATHEVSDGQEITLIPEDDDDMYTLSAVIRAGDRISASTMRSYKPTEDAPSEKVHLWLSGAVHQVAYYSLDSTLRIKTRLLSESQFVVVGSYHTFSIQLNAPLRIWKDNETPFDGFDREIIRRSLNPEQGGGNLSAIVMQEDVANICTVTPVRTIVRARIRAKTRSKRNATSASVKKAITNTNDPFFAEVLAKMTVTFPAANTQLIVASPGYTAGQFRKFCLAMADKLPERYPTLRQVATNMVVTHTSTGHVHGLAEAIRSGAANNNALTQQETLLEEIKTRIMNDDPRVCYSPKHVLRAFEMGAITGGATVFIGTNIFFETDARKRAEMSNILAQMRESGAKVVVMPASAEEGSDLYLLGGMAAFLSYPVPGLTDEAAFEEGERDSMELFVERGVEGLII